MGEEVGEEEGEEGEEGKGWGEVKIQKVISICETKSKMRTV